MTLHLLSAGYDGQRKQVYLKLYNDETNSNYIWFDTTGHLPYLLTKTKPKRIRHLGHVRTEQIQMFDAIIDEDIDVWKVIATDPLSIGGSHNSIRNELENSWENKITYYNRYIFDNQLIAGMPIEVSKEGAKTIVPLIPNEIYKRMVKALEDAPDQLKETMTDWARILSTPVPQLRRIATDIEVRNSSPNKIPDANKAEDPISAVSFAASDGFREVFVLNDTGKPVTTPIIEGGIVRVFDSERTMIEEAMNILDEYPIVITFNGDNFDFKFLRNRAKRLGVDFVPIQIRKKVTTLRNGIHIDLYHFFKNHSVKGYSFANKYRSNSLVEITTALLDSTKIKVGAINALSLHDLAEYCMQDSAITLELTTYDNNMVMDLMIMFARMAKLTVEDVTRLGVSRWIGGLFEWEHAKQNWIVPNKEEIIALKGYIATEAMIKGKKFKGAIVRDPVPGIHFDVTVFDFASLYPSAIRNWNLSYETILCPHDECKTNKIPQTPHHVCTLRHGMMSTIIGGLKDMRVLWYKPMSADKTLDDALRRTYYTVQQSIKVFLNASYGVFGSANFSMYCPPLAESTTAIGRHAIIETVKWCEENHIKVLYGDTDSVFLDKPSNFWQRRLIRWADSELGIDLEAEKTYRYAIFSNLKKNYLGVYKDGRVDVKGLTGKKRHTPPFIKNAFTETVDTLSKVETVEQFEGAKESIIESLQEVYKKIKNRDYTLDEFAFSMQLGKPLKSYYTNPPHVVVGRRLAKIDDNVGVGYIVKYVQTKHGWKHPDETEQKNIDVKHYTEAFESTMSQALDALGVQFELIKKEPIQWSLANWMRLPSERH